MERKSSFEIVHNARTSSYAKRERIPVIDDYVDKQQPLKC